MHTMQKMLNCLVIDLSIFGKTFIRHDHFMVLGSFAKEISLYITNNSQYNFHAFHMHTNKVVNVNSIFSPLCHFVKMCVDWGSSINCACHCKVVNNI